MTDSIYDQPDLHLNQPEDPATTSDAESMNNETVSKNRVKRSPASKADVKRKIMFDRKAHEKRERGGKRSPKKEQPMETKETEKVEKQEQGCSTETAPSPTKSKPAESVRPRGKENQDCTLSDTPESLNVTDSGKTFDSASPKKELNGIVKKNKFVVGESIRDKVHSRLRRASSNNIKRDGPNGILDKSQKSIDCYLQMDRRAGLRDRCKDIQDQTETAAIPAVAAVTAPSHKLHSNPTTPSRREGLSSRQVCATTATTPDKVKIQINCDTSPESKIIATVSPRNSLSGYRIPRKLGAVKNSIQSPTLTSPQKNIIIDSFSESTGSYHSPETRSARRKIESDLESVSSEKRYDNVDGEVSIRSSRDTTPEQEVRPTIKKRKGLGISRIAALNELRKNRLRRESKRDISDSEMSELHDSESEIALSDVDSESSFSGRVTRSKANENADISSVESVASTGRYKRRSRLSEKWSAALNSVSNS